MKAAWKHYIGWLACEFKLHKWRFYRDRRNNMKLMRECERCGLLKEAK